MKSKVSIDRTEQWEYTAYGYGNMATGSSEQSAELNLLRKVLAEQEENKNTELYPCPCEEQTTCTMNELCLGCETYARWFARRGKK